MRRDTPPAWTVARTFSICAVVPATGEAGVAVASRCPAVGALVPFVEAGVGAIASQAVCNPNFGPRGLARLRRGQAADEVVRRLIAEDITVTGDDPKSAEPFAAEQMTDEGADFHRDTACGRIVWYTERIRQLGVVDHEGRAAVHSGARLFDWFGSRTGEGYCCQGNMLAGGEVIEAMAGTFERARDGAPSLVRPLAEALRAGERAGGDRRGKQAAAIVVHREGAGWTGSGQLCDLRVDDHAEPVDELFRILDKTGFL